MERGNRTTHSRPGRWLWVLPIAYAAHIADEFFVGSGFYTWVGGFVPFSQRSFLGVNFMVVSLIAGAVWLARSTAWGPFLAVAVFTQFALHGLLVHPAFSLWEGSVSPGFVSGVAILLPLAAVGFRWAAGALPVRSLLQGVAAGFFLFASQDLWRIIFNSLLRAPAA